MNFRAAMGITTGLELALPGRPLTLLSALAPLILASPSPSPIQGPKPVAIASSAEKKLEVWLAMPTLPSDITAARNGQYRSMFW